MVFPKLKRRLSYLFTSEGRDFLRLYRSCAKRRRYRPLNNVSFGGLSFDVPDAPSFFWQYVDIFKNQSYLFRSDTSSPVIYDCGANVGVSVAYFKSLYPDARVVAFEPDKEIYGYLSRNLSRNNLLEDVALHNAAVWTQAKGVSFAIGSFPWEALRQLLSSIKASPGRSIFSRSTRAFRDMFIAASTVEAGES